MHRCEVRIEPIPKNADCIYTHDWWYADDGDPKDNAKLMSYPTCDLPANKKIGYVWVCDLHYERNRWLEDDDPEFGPPETISAILEGGDPEEDENAPLPSEDAL